MKTLIIDDEQNIRNAIKRMLRKSMSSVEVIETGKAEDVLKIIKTHKPDLIILDVLMPGMNGLEVLKVLKENEEREIRKIPVMMLTGVGNKEIIIKARKLGAVDYITKPIDEKIFLLKLKKYLR